MVPRILALLAAVAMVVGALAVRDRRDNDKVERATHLELACAPELDVVCQAIADTADVKVSVTLEEAGLMTDRLVGAKGVGFDGWLTPGPFPNMVEEVRQRSGLAGLVTKVSAPVASTRVGFAMWKDRAAALAVFCKKPAVDWKCLGDAAGRPWKDVGGQAAWGDVKVALPDPKATSSGLLVLGAATASYFGRTNLSSTELQDDDQFGAWLLGLARADRDADLDRMLAAGPSLVDAVAVLEQAAAPVIAAAAPAVKDRVTVIYPSPVATAGVVLGQASGKAGERLASLVTGQLGRNALVEAGWTAPAAATSNLPSPGLLYFLRSQWSQ